MPQRNLFCSSSATWPVSRSGYVENCTILGIASAGPHVTARPVESFPSEASTGKCGAIPRCIFHAKCRVEWSPLWLTSPHGLLDQIRERGLPGYPSVGGDSPTKRALCANKSGPISSLSSASQHRRSASGDRSKFMRHSGRRIIADYEVSVILL